MISVSSEEMMDDSRNVTGIPKTRPTEQDCCMKVPVATDYMCKHIRHE